MRQLVWGRKTRFLRMALLGASLVILLALVTTYQAMAQDDGGDLRSQAIDAIGTYGPSWLQHLQQQYIDSNSEQLSIVFSIFVVLLPLIGFLVFLFYPAFASR